MQGYVCMQEGSLFLNVTLEPKLQQALKGSGLQHHLTLQTRHRYNQVPLIHGRNLVGYAKGLEVELLNHMATFYYVLLIWIMFPSSSHEKYLIV